MARSRRERGKRHSPEQFVRKLREADELIARADFAPADLPAADFVAVDLASAGSA